MKVLKKVIYIVVVMILVLLSGYIIYSFSQFKSKSSIKLEDLIGVTYRSKNQENYLYLANEENVVFYVNESYYSSKELTYEKGIITITTDIEDEESDKVIKLAFIDYDHVFSSTFNMFFYNENLFNE